MRDMSPKTLIAANPTFEKELDMDNDYVGHLEVSEFFCDTIQGENFVGFPSAFLRLQHCTLNCVWCDSQEVWKFGNPYSFAELFKLMEDPEFDLIWKLREGQHLVLTGGSPLKQQMELIKFIEAFIDRYSFKPFIEIENECTLMPSPFLAQYIDCWNNSPKLSNSGNPMRSQHIPRIIERVSKLKNSWFKFVVSSQKDWEEIETLFLSTRLIHKKQVVLMPLGETREEIEKNREIVLDIAINNNVRYTTREHVIIWDKKTGV